MYNILSSVVKFVSTQMIQISKCISQLHPFPVKSKVWNKVSFVVLSIWQLLTTIQIGNDLVGPLPTTSSGNHFIVTLMDYFSKWPETVSFPDKST